MITERDWGRALGRAFRKRCPRCGAKGIFATYFQLRERCPSCGYRFKREEGAISGGLMMAWVFTVGLTIIPLLAYVFWRGISGDETIPFWPFAATGIALAVLVPLLGYPYTASTWAAIDLVSRPLDADELADAAAHRAD